MHLVAQLSNQDSSVTKLVRQFEAFHAGPKRRSKSPPTMAQHVRLDPREIAALADLFQKGATIQEVADRFAVHRTTARTQLMRLELWPPMS